MVAILGTNLLPLLLLLCEFPLRLRLLYLPLVRFDCVGGGTAADGGAGVVGDAPPVVLMVICARCSIFDGFYLRYGVR